MSRAVFLSSAGDPFLAELVLSLWNRHWRDEIDTFYIGYNNHAEVSLSVSHEFLRKWEKDPKIRIVYTPHGVGNGVPVTQMLLNSKEDSLVLLEDDAFCFTPGIVDGWFKIVESGQADMVGSARYAAGEIAEAAKKKYNLDYSGLGDRGFGFWPNFFVCKLSDLLKTDLDFGSNKYPKGKYFKELDHTFENDDFTDTFTWASIQLRYLGLKLWDIPQNHAHPFDLTFKNTKEGMFTSGAPKYIHGGSLSSGWNGYLNKKLPSLKTDMEKQDLETRCAWWTIAMMSTLDYGGFLDAYNHGLNNLINNGGLDNRRIGEKIKLYAGLLNI